VKKILNGIQSRNIKFVGTRFIHNFVPTHFSFVEWQGVFVSGFFQR